MKLALPNPSGESFEFTAELRSDGLEASRASPRRRMLLPVHRNQEDLVQRMINFLQPGTYIRPHLHPRDHATESIIVMEGALGFVVFAPTGEVRSVHRLEAGALVDIEARVWHTVVALAPDTIIAEFKRGPYDDQDKVFAEWAPEEGGESCSDYLADLEQCLASAPTRGAAGPTA